jgi:HD-GYP domain-containing protein (c-di-GMP phosphodiesterase class II)
VHRKLITGVLIMGVVIAAAVGTGVWHQERRDVGKDVLKVAEDGFERFNDGVRSLLNTPEDLPAAALDTALAATMAQRHTSTHGAFVWIGVYDLKGARVATGQDATYPEMNAVQSIVSRKNTTWATYNKLSYHVVFLAGTPYIRIMSPLKNDLNDLSGYGEAVFAVAPEMLEVIRTRALRQASLFAAVVMLTAALIYPVVLALLNRVATLSARLYDANLEMLKVLGSAVAKRDSDTDAHNYRVTLIAVRLANAVGLDHDGVRRLIKGAFLHDVGKIGIQDEILHKPGRLTEEEFTVMQRHVPYGLDIVRKAAWIHDAADIVACHHEKYDGSGYGAGLKGTDIPVTARIFAIADVFDALTSRRPYKDPFSLEKTMAIVEEGRGTHFDPALVDAFAAMAPDIHASYAGREDDALREELAALIQRYFYAV